MAKNNVEIKNPLASMGLDDVIRGFTDPNSHKEVKVERRREQIYRSNVTKCTYKTTN